MPLHQQNFYSDQWLDTTFKPHSFTAIVEPLKALQDDRHYFIRRSLQKRQYSWSLIEPRMPFIPTVNLRENILMAFSKKERAHKELELHHLCQQFGLDERIFQHVARSATPEETLYVQMLTNLLQAKKIWLCLNPFSDLSIRQTQLFLDLFHQIVARYQLSIILLTNDEQIVTSKYIDAYFQLEAIS